MQAVESSSSDSRALADRGECPLQRSFLHLPRIGLRTERKLWREGVHTWDDLEEARRPAPDLFGRRTSPLLDAIDASRRALDAGDAAFFAERLPGREHHRIAASFPMQTAFLDIETTGLSLYYDTITLIGCAQGETYACHVMGTGDDADNAAIDLIESAKCVTDPAEVDATIRMIDDLFENSSDPTRSTTEDRTNVTNQVNIAVFYRLYDVTIGGGPSHVRWTR